MFSSFYDENRLGILAGSPKHRNVEVFVRRQRERWSISCREISLPAGVVLVCQEKGCKHIYDPVRVQALYSTDASCTG